MFAKFDENGKIQSYSEAGALEEVRPSPDGFEAIGEFGAEDLSFLCKKDGQVQVDEILKAAKAEEKEKYRQYAENKANLVKLAEDIVQSLAGEDVPQIEERKAEFVRIHNLVREYEGKQARELAQA